MRNLWNNYTARRPPEHGDAEHRIAELMQSREFAQQTADIAAALAHHLDEAMQANMLATLVVFARWTGHAVTDLARHGHPKGDVQAWKLAIISEFIDQASRVATTRMTH